MSNEKPETCPVSFSSTHNRYENNARFAYACTKPPIQNLAHKAIQICQKYVEVGEREEDEINKTENFNGPGKAFFSELK